MNTLTCSSVKTNCTVSSSLGALFLNTEHINEFPLWQYFVKNFTLRLATVRCSVFRNRARSELDKIGLKAHSLTHCCA